MAVNLSTLTPPPVIENIDYESLFTDIHAFFVRKNPAYTSIVEGDPGYTSMEAMAYFGTTIFGRINDAVKALLITHATGADLETLVAGFNVERRPQESDDELRTRAIETLETLVPGSPAWYKNNALEATLNVRDARVLRKPDPNDPNNTIGGEVNVYVQGVDSVIPNTETLKTVKDYIAAEGSTYDTTEEQDIAEQRRFICDTVNILPVETLYYVICAEIHVLPGLSKLDILESVQAKAQAFVDENARIGNKIPLSSIYAVLDTESVSEVTLEYPTADIDPDKLTVPVAEGNLDLTAMPYKAFGTWNTFGDTAEAAWTLGTNASKNYIIFTEDITSTDRAILNNVMTCRRFGVYTPNADLVYTYKTTAAEITYVNGNGRTHYAFELQDTPTTTNLTLDDEYIVRAINSIEITVAGL